MPLMLAMFIALEIHSFLSLAFQKEKVNIVSAMRVITKTNDYLVLFEKKNNLQNFPVWNIYYQNVIKLTVKIPTKMVNSLTLKNLVSTFALKKKRILRWILKTDFLGKSKAIRFSNLLYKFWIPRMGTRIGHDGDAISDFECKDTVWTF